MTGPSFWSQFELRQLRCFVAAAEELHFGRAAQRMHMTQPPLSRQIQLLEHVLGVKLLDRTSRAVKLTPAGRVFLLEARRILRLTESAALATRRIASGEAGTPSGPQRVDVPLARHIATSLLGASFDIAFSAKLQVDHGISHAIQYLLDGLSAIDSDVARVSFTTPTRPAVITGKPAADGPPDYRYVLMPIRSAG